MPAGRGAAWKSTQQFEDQITVEVKEALGNVNAGQSAVALNFALIGIDLDSPECSLLNLWVGAFPQSGQKITAQCLGISMEAKPQVQVRVVVTDEEPAIYPSGGKHLLNEGLDRLDQQAVHVGRAGIDLGIEPL